MKLLSHEVKFIERIFLFLIFFIIGILGGFTCALLDLYLGMFLGFILAGIMVFMIGLVTGAFLGGENGDV